MSDQTFHEKPGYWLWDKDNGLVLKALMVPRGVTVNAGGCVAENDKRFRLQAECSSETYANNIV